MFFRSKQKDEKTLDIKMVHNRLHKSSEEYLNCPEAMRRLRQFSEAVKKSAQK